MVVKIIITDEINKIMKKNISCCKSTENCESQARRSVTFNGETKREEKSLMRPLFSLGTSLDLLGAFCGLPKCHRVNL